MQDLADGKVKQVTEAIQAAQGQPNLAVQRAATEARRASTRAAWEERKLRNYFGIPGSLIRNAVGEDESPSANCKDVAIDDVLRAAGDADNLDEMTAVALSRLVPMVDAEWLAREAQRPYRLDDALLHEPLQLVNGIRLSPGLDIPGPQRFARMLLLAQDFLDNKPGYDFFTGAGLVPELAALGNSLDEIERLGDEARKKLLALGSMPDDVVSSTVYELMVGAAFVRLGLEPSMVRETKSGKVPEYYVNFGPIPGAIECKRRAGLTRYERAEAEYVRTLYEGLRPVLQEQGVHSSIEVSFRLPLKEVDGQSFHQDVLAMTARQADVETTETSWGTVGVQRLVIKDEFNPTRLYSPYFLERTFSWKQLQTDWDGIICEVDQPGSIIVSEYYSPLCLKWRSESEEAIAKKARGVISLWGAAINQIPDGRLGFIYLAYPEGARPAIADARTENVQRSLEQSWHRWGIRVPVTVVTRLYPRAIADGLPDLIENSLLGTSKGYEIWAKKVPGMIFTRQWGQ